MGKRVLVVAATTGYSTRVYQDAGQRLGFEVTLALDRCLHLEGSWGKDAIPVRFETPGEAAALLSQSEPKPEGVIALGDRPTEIASLTAAALGLPFHAHEAVLACRNKLRARERFEAAGLRVPEYFQMPLYADAAEFARSARYPCVLKPVGLSGSRGVIRADYEGDFCAAVERIRPMLQRDEQGEFLLVESYIPGREFAVEGVVTHGRLQPLAIFDKPDPLEGPFFEETLYVTPSRECEAVQAALVEATQAGVSALGLTHGPIHAEMRFNEEGVWLLEIAARPIGGLCSGALRFDGGVPLEELLLRHAAGEDVSGLRRETCASGVMMIPIPASGIYNGVSGVGAETVITAVPGQRLVKLPEGASYLGFIFARAETAALVEQSLRSAHSGLKFDIATELSVI